MALYDYTCGKHKWEVSKPMSDLNRKERCPQCKKLGKRTLNHIVIGIPKEAQADFPYTGKRK